MSRRWSRALAVLGGVAALGVAAPAGAQESASPPLEVKVAQPPPPPPQEALAEEAPTEEAQPEVVPEAKATQAAEPQAAPLRPGANPNPTPPLDVIRAVSSGSPGGIGERFIFGTYGRVSAGSDLQGGLGRQVRIIAHPPRLLEGAYAELDFGYLHTVEETGTRFFTRSTLALGGDLFHADGDFDATWAVRNLYVEAQDVGTKGLSFWVGSRMYRGDDIYLLDFWPLDEQNTVGGGGAFAWSKDGNIKLHAGINRLDDPFYVQYVTVTGEDFGTREVLHLDRPRIVSTVRAEQHLTLSGDTRLKGVLYGEVHALPSGQRRNEDQTDESLPAERGWLLGGEVGVYGFGKNSYANVFARYGADLAAYDELGVPGDLALDKTTTGASELQFGLSANYETGSLGLLSGAYARGFVDADGVIYDVDDTWEVGAALRPAWFVTRHIHMVGEVNVQYQRPNGVSPETQRQEVPMVWQLALMPSLSLDAASYARPQLRLIYAVSLLNDAALLRFAPEDVRRDRPTQHFLGVSVEWWFNSSRG